MSGPGGSIDVLHVDDDPQMGTLTAEHLERANDRFAIEVVASGPEAIERLSREGVDCIVSDFDMPEQDGIELLEAVRQDYPDLPFILYTGKGSETVASDAISAGVTDYLQKESGTSQYEVLAKRIENAVEQRRAELDAAETEQRLRTIAENSNDILWKFTADWDELLFINSPYEEIWGRSIDELREDPQSFLRGIHPDDRPLVETAMEELSAGEPVDIEYRVNAEQDFGRWVWVQGEPVFDDAGEVVKVVGFARDVTERKERERELEQSQELTEALITTLPDYAFIYNAEGVYRDVITGWEGGPTLYTREELIGRNVANVLATETAEVIQEAIEATLETGELQTIEYPVETAGGTYWYEANLAPLLTGYGDEPAVVLSARDITDRRARERELRRQNERLEEFASLVSHDLRNPLNVANGRLELAMEDGDSDHLEAIAQAHDRMETLIDDMLSLANAGEAVGEIESVDLSGLAEACWRNVETESAELEIEIHEAIQADGMRLRQLLENLLRNAVEHGGDAVTVTVGDLPDGFYVEDDGPGIPPDEWDDVFTPGYSGRSQGTGFGLNIVRDIAEAHGWTIEVSTGVDGGARFEFTGVSPA